MEAIGRYEIKRKIAEGMFSTLFEATEPAPPKGLGRRVALKLCSSEDEQLRQRFALEVELIAQLGHHPNIAAAYDIGFHEGAPYLVEEYLSGEDLRHKIGRKDDASAKTKVSWLLQIAKGLAFAHSKEIVHRDIKPENVRITDSGQVKIIDFGIGRAVSSEATRLTTDGTIMGTLGYLAPEQLKGQADLKSDIFSFGVLAYELLTYTHPFSAKNLREQFKVLMEKEPEPISKLWPACKPGLEKLVLSCLEKDVENRIASFDDVVEGLRQQLRDFDLAAAAPMPDASQETFILDKETLESMAEAEPAPAEEPAPEKPKEVEAKPKEAKPKPAEEKPPAKEAKPAEKPPEKRPEPKKPAAKKEARPEPKAAPAEPKAPQADTPAAEPAPEPAPDKKAPPPPAAGVGKRPSFGAAASQALARVGPAVQSGLAALGKLPKWALWGGAGVLGLVVLLTAFLSGGAEETPAEVMPEPLADVAPAEPAPIATGTAHLHAFPWAEVVRLENPTEGEIPLEQACTTPCSLDLEPGLYTAHLVNPAFPDQELACQLSVGAGEATDCHVVFGEMTPLDYFKASGWWS